MRTHEKLALATILEMRGKDGKPEYTGGAGVCVCPKCQTEVSHNRGIPCNQMMCPSCKTPTPMTGKNTVGQIKN